MTDLPQGSALTVIFDSCTSATPLGKISIHARRPQSLMFRKTSNITGATVCIDPGSIGEVVGPTSLETALVCQHCTHLVRCYPLPHPLAQSGGIRRQQGYRQRRQPTRVGIQTGKGVKFQSDAMDGAARGQRSQPFSMLMWYVGL